MSVKLLAENILTAEDFLSATEQEGEHIGQPIPDSANTGAFRLLSKGDENGDIADFTYNGTATSDGAVGGTTVLDALLAAYGDDYFIGGSVAITDFLQDTADYTEQDVFGRVVKTDASTITVTSLDTDEEAWVVLDEGAAHFAGDFEFHVDLKCTGATANEERVACWAIANTVDTLGDIQGAGGDFLAVYWYSTGLGEFIEMRECNNGATGTSSRGVVQNTDYYLKIVRDESVGTYGTLYCYIYTDATHTTLVNTISRILTEKQDFQYLYWLNVLDSGGGAAWDGIISNLKIVESESKTVSDFAQATGTITIGAFTYQVNTGTAFTLTVAYATRDFRVELITSGDAGDATFKWSHNGGTTYLGRDDPDQANWLAESEIDAVVDVSSRSIILEAANGDLVEIHEDGAAVRVECRISSDGGLTWGAAITIVSLPFTCPTGAVLLNGRIFLLLVSGAFSVRIAYSDDNGQTWVVADSNLPFGSSELLSDISALSTGRIVWAIGGGTIRVRFSDDGGFQWSDLIDVADLVNAQDQPSVCEAANGDIVICYRDDSDLAGDKEIKCAISTNGGETWTNDISVIDYVATDLGQPVVRRDINGDLYCVCQKDTGDQSIVYSKSSDNGQTWGAETTLKSSAGADLAYPWLVAVRGHELLCGYVDTTNGDFDLVRRGIWEAYVANACLCAVEAQEQKLICDVGIIWHGGAGEIGDDWQFEAEYDFAMDNIISDSPSKFWRSEQDNIACRIVIDMGANERLLVDGAGFFNCNVRTLSFQANTTDTWGAPLVDESVSFDLVTGIVDHITGNAVEDDSLLANYDDHYFKTDNYYLRMTSGTDDGETWKILDNVGGYIFLDTTAAVGIAAADTFVIFQGWTAKAFTNRMPYRFFSIYISAQETAEGYYKIGFTPIGKTVTLDRRWTGGYENPHVYNIDLLQTPQGGLIPIKHAERYREFELTWPFSENTRKQLVALLDYLDRKNICLIPDDSIDNQGSDNCFIECYLVKLIGGLEQTDGFDKRLDIKLRFREIL